MPILVTERELLDVMVEGQNYRADAVARLMNDAPTAVVRDTLDGLARKGKVWKTYTGGRWEYVRLSSQDFADMRQRRADRIDIPLWMRGGLTGYTAALARHQSVCLASRTLFRP
ncbi:TPA: hypothetical protein ACU967_002285 [Burkholderia contaminans]|uniref:hypothetical protein n=1 Tax=Burkholderia contaminans TaxID=488447 RepID=UPI000D0031B9|nr:hypothetical protein [Burkholderia contaminans]HDR9065527.1 hypothetical protein [Burkholderia vietnamiensis]MBM6427966.1 hypothetical protein [Burkholderia contaminans]MCA7876796.1 hypothetical protein [Burkholderia contaminans]MDN8024180.1 hypothetical protein [Burkholderia contaminans]PRG12182.1 hypothetical protein C6Q17_14080 [Burkholderia contaminans]